MNSRDLGEEYGGRYGYRGHRKFWRVPSLHCCARRLIMVGCVPQFGTDNCAVTYVIWRGFGAMLKSCVVWDLYFYHHGWCFIYFHDRGSTILRTSATVYQSTRYNTREDWIFSSTFLKTSCLADAMLPVTGDAAQSILLRDNVVLTRRTSALSVTWIAGEVTVLTKLVFVIARWCTHTCNFALPPAVTSH
jgi:hypothetical protein